MRQSPSFKPAPQNSSRFALESSAHGLTAQLTVLALMVAVGTVSRWLIEVPNFKPIMALGLFGGYFYARKSWALFAVFACMLSSDLLLGGYALPVMLSVYGSLLLPIAWGRWLQSLEQQSPQTTPNPLLRRMAVVATASLANAVLFFLVTNAAVWAWSGWYPLTLAGLQNCFLAALPFLKYSLSGNLVFGLGLFSLHAVATRLASRWSPRLNPLTEINRH